jgi:hypothetical protein
MTASQPTRQRHVQKAASFTIDQAMEQMETAASGAGHYRTGVRRPAAGRRRVRGILSGARNRSHPRRAINVTIDRRPQLASDVKGVMAQGIKGVAEIAMATHAGMTTDEFDTIVRDWIATDGDREMLTGKKVFPG